MLSKTVKYDEKTFFYKRISLKTNQRQKCAEQYFYLEPI